MCYIIKAINKFTEESIIYTRKQQRTLYIDGKKYKYYVPYLDPCLELKIYSTERNCQIAIEFLREQLKIPSKSTEGNIIWRDAWDLSMIKIGN